VLLATHNFAEAAAVADRLLLSTKGMLEDRKLNGRESADDLANAYFGVSANTRLTRTSPCRARFIPQAAS